MIQQNIWMIVSNEWIISRTISILFPFIKANMKPITLNDYRLYFGNTRYIKLIAQHFLRGHHKDDILYTMEYEWLEDNVTIDF